MEAMEVVLQTVSRSWGCTTAVFRAQPPFLPLSIILLLPLEFLLMLQAGAFATCLLSQLLFFWLKLIFNTHFLTFCICSPGMELLVPALCRWTWGHVSG